MTFSDKKVSKRRRGPFPLMSDQALRPIAEERARLGILARVTTMQAVQHSHYAATCALASFVTVTAWTTPWGRFDRCPGVWAGERCPQLRGEIKR
jgi:hypothetical protein